MWPPFRLKTRRRGGCRNEVSACHPCRESWARSRLLWRAVHEESQQPEKKRGSFEGAIRIPLRASLFLFNDLGFLHVPRKSLKFHSSLFSIPTAPTNHLLESESCKELGSNISTRLQLNITDRLLQCVPRGSRQHVFAHHLQRDRRFRALCARPNDASASAQR